MDAWGALSLLSFEPLSVAQKILIPRRTTVTGRPLSFRARAMPGDPGRKPTPGGDLRRPAGVGLMQNACVLLDCAGEMHAGNVPRSGISLVHNMHITLSGRISFASCNHQTTMIKYSLLLLSVFLPACTTVVEPTVAPVETSTSVSRETRTVHDPYTGTQRTETTTIAR
jgi:hypothetical protein